MLGSVAALGRVATAWTEGTRPRGAVLARGFPATVAAAPGAPADHTSLWLLIAAGLIGFAAAWLIIEVRRAWTEPEHGRTRGHASDRDVADLTREITALQADLARLRVGRPTFEEPPAEPVDAPFAAPVAEPTAEPTAEPLPSRAAMSAGARLARQREMIDELTSWPSDSELIRFEQERAQQRAAERAAPRDERSRRRRS